MDGVSDVIFFVSRKNGICTKKYVDEVGNDPDGVLITEKPEIIVVSMGEEFDADHFLHGLVGMLYLSVN